MKRITGRKDKKTGHRPVTTGILALAMTFVMTVGCFNSAVWAASSDADYFGECTEQSTFNKESSELKDSYYFSDSWFQQDAAVRNDSLALVSMQLTAAYTKDPGADGTGFLEGLGFTDIAFNSAAETDPEACNYTHGRKTLADGTTLIAVVIQSYSEDSTVKEQGWRQNFMVNGEDETAGEHFAFARAADKVIGDIEALGDSDTVFWVMGQSRGGALTNLIAKRLGDSGRKVYAYTFEAPATVDAGSVTEDYGYIHNYLCHDDIVTKIPMWGMTRYGNAYELKTDETDQDLQEELNKLGSEAAEGDVPNAEWIETDVVDYLGSRVAAREDYSAEHNDIFTDKETGEEITYTYSYQGSLMNLIGVIFRGGLSDVAGYLADNVADAWPAVSYLAEAVKLDGTEEALPYYYGAAKELHAFLSDASVPIDLSVKDMYAVLRLIGPFALDEDYEPTDDPGGDVMGYLSPVINVALQAGNMTYSHHFDTLIARLKTLAPAPEIEDIDIKITAPEAGDDMDKAPSEVAEFFKDDSFRDAKDSLWISAEACWDTDDEKLQDDCVYYLDVTLETVGHTVPEDLWLKLNGELPAKDPVVTYDEGRGITRVTFEFKIGEPPEIKVSFDTGGKTDAPSPVTVEKGTSLGTVDQPDIPEITEADGVRYKLDGWYDENGTPWEDVKVSEPVTMYAKWLIYIDQIDVTFVVPALGDKITDAAVPEDAPYSIFGQNVTDPDYETTEVASLAGQYYIYADIELNDPENSVFAVEKNEWDTDIYVGKFTINGEEIEEPDFSEDLFYGLFYAYDVIDNHVYFSFYFPVTEKETSDVSYTIEKGSGQTWTRGSDQGAEFVVKRSYDDEQTFDLFKELQIDGETVSGDAYTKEKGSLIIDLKAPYLETLSEGSHDLTVVFEDGTAETDFTITDSVIPDDEGDGPDEGDGSVVPGGEPGDDISPGDDDTVTPTDEESDKPAKTGDSTDLITWMILLAASLSGLAGLCIKRRYNKI